MRGKLIKNFELRTEEESGRRRRCNIYKVVESTF